MKTKRKIKVLIVDDSILFRKTLTLGLEKDEGIEIVGVAADPYEARDKIIELNPDVLTLDVEMPKMSGIEFLKRLLPQHPIPVVVVSSLNDNVFDAINAGAVDFVEKPKVSKQEDLDNFFKDLSLKIKIASTAKLERKNTTITKSNSNRKRNENSNYRENIIAIGASTGGTEAVADIIKTFPKDMPPVLVVQHMPPVFTKMYAERLNKICNMEVKEAEDGELIEPGKIIIAKGGYHMSIKKKGSNFYANVYEGEKVNGHCPSVDPMFEAVAELYGKKSIGVILTGMGTDGAKGLLKMKKEGAYTIGQDEKSSVVYGMPRVAYNIGAVITQKPLSEIADEIFSSLNMMKRG
jgi:two-component system chemotaxis response regulator CheB